MIPGNPVPTPDYPQSATGGYSAAPSGGFSSNGGSSSVYYGPAGAPAANYTSAVTGQPAYAPAPNQQAVLGANASQTGSSGGSGGGYVDPTPGGFGSAANPDLSNSFKQNLYNQYMSSQQNAAAASAAAQIQATTNMYNNLRSQLETQRPVLDQAYQSGLSDVQNQIDTGVQQGQANQGLLSSQYTQGQGTLGQQYQDSQAQNRELARAVGGNGSDYAQLQNRTNNSYQNNMYQAYNDYSTRSQQIAQGIQSLQTWGQSQKASLATQYQQGINQLVLNENMTDFSKADAISKIQSDYSNQLANINSVVAQFGNQLALAKAQVDTTAAMFGKSIQGYDPLANMAQMYYGSLGQQAPTVDTSGGISYPDQNKTAGGINNNNQGAASF